MRGFWLPGAALVLLSFPWGASAGDDTVASTKVYTDHPRLFLRPQRLRLLRRETGRDSLRWEQFHLLMAGGAPMEEPGFAGALYFRATDDVPSARRAIEWVMAQPASAGDIRQISLVYDWCREQLSSAEKQKFLQVLRAAAERRGPHPTLDQLRSQVLAAIAIAGDDDAVSQAAIGYVLHDQWAGTVMPALKAGKMEWKPGDTYALYEIFHAVRDNLNVDLREDFLAYFAEFPLFDLLSYYPPPYSAAENEFRIPWSPTNAAPDLRTAALSRAGELAMVALDTNAPASQVLQGWLMNDRFLMRGLFGIPYEFLWANPYQPGLSYYHVPLVMYDETVGRLLVRSSWEDDALWAGLIEGQLQEFRDGHLLAIDLQTAREPLDLEEATILFPAQSAHFVSGKKPANDVFVVGLDSQAAFHVEPDDEEMEEISADHAGVLFLKGVRPDVPVRLTKRPLPSRSAATGPAGETNP